MNIGQFSALLKKAGDTVTILRPSTADTFSMTMGSPGVVRDETLALEAKQSDEQVVICRLDFDGQAFTIPQEGDRITDVDGDIYSIEQVKKMYGPARELYGWKLRIRG